MDGWGHFLPQVSEKERQTAALAAKATRFKARLDEPIDACLWTVPDAEFPVYVRTAETQLRTGALSVTRHSWAPREARGWLTVHGR
jgi:hypothetical protein